MPLIGNNISELEANLRVGISGIREEPDYAKNGFRSQFVGIQQIDLD